MCWCNTNMNLTASLLVIYTRVLSTCLLSFKSKDLQILQQSDLKTPYDKTKFRDSLFRKFSLGRSLMRVSSQSVFWSIPLLVTEVCHLVLTSLKLSWWCRCRANHRADDIIVNLYIGSLAQECNFLTEENRKKQTAPFLDWIATGSAAIILQAKSEKCPLMPHICFDPSHPYPYSFT